MGGGHVIGMDCVGENTCTLAESHTGCYIWYTSGQRLFAAKHKIVLCAKRNQARI